MKRYQVLVKKRALKTLGKLDPKTKSFLKNAIQKLENNPRPYGYKKLEAIRAYRIRVGHYRIIYNIKDKEIVVVIVAIGHRKDIYKQKT